MGDNSILFTVSTWIIPILLAVPLHEAAHGWVAWKLGDDTAFRAGRVTFNPFKHIDPFGTLLLPAGLLFVSGGSLAFGYAKPVPVAFWNLRRPRRDMALVALAGPGSNLFLASVSAALFQVLPFLPDEIRPWVAATLTMSVLLNLILFFFNLIPLPPLDGGRVLVAVLPQNLAIQVAKLERAGFVIIIGALFLLPWMGRELGTDLNIFRWLVSAPAFSVGEFLVRLFGVN